MTEKFSYTSVNIDNRLSVSFDGEIEVKYTVYESYTSYDSSIDFTIEELEEALKVAKAQRDKYKAYQESLK